MAIAETRYEHFILNQTQVPTISGTTTKVIELVVEKLAYGWSPEELHFQHPHLTLRQIYSALAYYWDHREEFGQEIAQRLERENQIRQQVRPAPLMARLKKDKGR